MPETDDGSKAPKGEHTAGRMNELTKWVVTVLGYSFALIITNEVISPWFGRTASPFLEEVAKQIISFFGGIMAKTGYDMATQGKVELTNDEKNPVPVVPVPDTKESETTPVVEDENKGKDE